ncbi:MAG TPA: hypothetical protein VD789_03800 [Thermomicrobiales bacterium]|nr:hypothetical protein [Thermomicrobiales bacterium]
MPFPHPVRRLAIVFGATALLATSAAAQDATPPTRVDPGPVYPVSIHEGTCEAPVAQPVGLTSDTSTVGLESDSEFVGVTSQPSVHSATLEYDGTLDELTGEPHVVAVHASPDAYGTIVACGEIAGYEHDGTMVIPVRAVASEEVSGIAVVHQGRSLLDRALEQIDTSVDFTDDSVKVIVYLIPDNELHADR